MDLGLEHIVPKQVIDTKLDYSSVEAIVELFQANEELDQFIALGDQLIVAFENVSDICRVINKYGVTESLVSLVGSNFIAMEDNSPSVTDAEPDDGDDAGSGMNEKIKEDAAKVADGAEKANKGLIEKIKGWLKSFGEWVAKWWNKAIEALKNLQGKAKALANKVRSKVGLSFTAKIPYTDENGEVKEREVKINGGREAAAELEKEIEACKECEAKKAEAQKAADEAKAALAGNPDSKKLQNALTKANRKLGAAKAAVTVHTRALGTLLSKIEAKDKATDDKKEGDAGEQK